MFTKVRILLLAAFVVGCERHPMDFRPVTKLSYSSVYKLCCGTWQMDEESLAYYRNTLGYRTALSVADHSLILYPYGDADIRCDGAYVGQMRGGVSIPTAPRDFMDRRPPSVFHGVRGRWTVRTYSDIPKEFAAWEFSDDRPLGWKWQVAISITDEINNKSETNSLDEGIGGSGEYEFFLGEDDRGLYLAPRTYSSDYPRPMERVLKFREINGSVPQSPTRTTEL